MYGKIFESLFSGSMVGAGAHVFAVMSYIIAKQQPDREVGSQVELNPKLLAFILGESQARIEEAIEYLCSPDPDTTTPDDEGRRLVKIGQFSYRVVNGAKYRAIRDEEERREQNRDAQRRRRARLVGNGKRTPEQAYEEGRASEYAKRRKPAGLREAKRNGQMDGARQAIAEGLEEANGLPVG